MENIYDCYCLHTFKVKPTVGALKHGFTISQNEKYPGTLLNHDTERYVKEVILEDTQTTDYSHGRCRFNNDRFREIKPQEDKFYWPASGFILRFCLLFNSSYDKKIVYTLIDTISDCFVALDNYIFCVHTVDYILFTAVTNCTAREFLRKFNVKVANMKDLNII